MVDDEHDGDDAKAEPADSPETTSDDEEGAVGTLGLPDLSGEDDDE